MRIKRTSALVLGLVLLLMLSFALAFTACSGKASSGSASGNEVSVAVGKTYVVEKTTALTSLKVADGPRSKLRTARVSPSPWTVWRPGKLW